MRLSWSLVALLAALMLGAPASANAAPPVCGPVTWTNIASWPVPTEVDAGETVHGALTCGGDAGAELTISVLQPPAHGTLGPLTALSLPFRGVRLTLTPDAAYRGPDEFVLRVTDGVTVTDTTIRVAVVAPTNAKPFCDAPYIAQPGGRSVQAGTPITVNYGCADDGAGPLAFSVLTPPAHGTATIVPTAANVGALTYTPDVTYSGPDELTVRVVDGEHVIDRTFSFEVAPSTAPPPVQEQPRTELPAPPAIDQLVLSSTPSVTNVSALDKRIAKVCGKLKGSRKATCAKRERALAKCGAMKAKTRKQKAAKAACTKRAKLIGATPAKTTR